MNKMIKSVVVGVSAAFLTVGAVGGTAVATGLITSEDIQNHTIKQRDLSPGLKDKVNRTAVPGPKGDKGDTGATGPQGASGLAGAVYRVTEYANGGGGSATTACADTNEESMKYVAIAGGVQGSESGVSETQDGFLVSSSFPGRMDWSTGTPKPNRLDGWIVFGNSQYTDTLRVWALCVPAASIPVQTVTIDN